MRQNKSVFGKLLHGFLISYPAVPVIQEMYTHNTVSTLRYKLSFSLTNQQSVFALELSLIGLCGCALYLPIPTIVRRVLNGAFLNTSVYILASLNIM